MDQLIILLEHIEKRGLSGKEFEAEFEEWTYFYRGFVLFL